MLRSVHLVTFVAIAESGSLNGAAGALGVSRSVVSERLAALEADLGTRMITRSPHGMSLTPAGERFLAHAREIVEAMDTARDAVADAGGVPSGHLRIAVPEALANIWLAPILVRFLDAHPRITMEVAASDGTVDIVRDGFDLAIRSARLADSDLLARRLTTGRRMLVCSPDYASRHGTPKTLSELGDHTIICSRNRRISQDWTFRTETGLRAPKVTGRVETSGGALACAMARDGLGVTLLPTFITARDLVAGTLVPVDIGLEPDIDTVAAVFPRANRAVPRVRALVDHVRRALGDPPTWDRDLMVAGILPPT